jgi:hypothetical protein
MLRQSMESLAYQTSYYGGVSVSIPGSNSSRWPFVTVENFHNQSQYVQTIADYPIVFFSPIITSPITRRTWELYAIPQLSLEQDPLPFRQIWGRIFNETKPATANTTSRDIVNANISSPATLRTSNFTYGPVPRDSIGPFHPIYQVYEGPVSPVTQSRRLQKRGLRYSYINRYETLRRNQQQVNGNSSLMLFDMMTASGYQQFYTNVIQKNNFGFVSDVQPLELYRIKYNLDIFEPLSLVTEPIFPSIDNRTTTTSPIVGTINTILQWKSLFVDILRTEQVPVHTYIQNTCGDQFTHTIIGPSVTFDGYSPKDHFSNYSEIAIGTSLDNPSYPTKSKNGTTGTFFCSYKLTIYPLRRNSSNVDNGNGNGSEQQASKTLALMLGTGVPLVLLVFVCIIYDYCRYSRMIRDLHARPDRALSNDKDQVFVPVTTSSSSIPMTNNNRESAPITNLREFIERKITDDFAYDVPEHIPREPLADHYANATILSANLVGFYTWASEYEPSKVFLFLEELQRTFESIAKERRIYIVDSFGGETSSCIAVSGILGSDTEHGKLSSKIPPCG